MPKRNKRSSRPARSDAELIARLLGVRNETKWRAQRVIKQLQLRPPESELTNVGSFRARIVDYDGSERIVDARYAENQIYFYLTPHCPHTLEGAIYDGVRSVRIPRAIWTRHATVIDRAITWGRRLGIRCDIQPVGDQHA